MGLPACAGKITCVMCLLQRQLILILFSSIQWADNYVAVVVVVPCILVALLHCAGELQWALCMSFLFRSRMLHVDMLN